MRLAIQDVLPHALSRVHVWAERFRRLNAPLPHFRALSSRARDELLTSRVELLPSFLLDRPISVVDCGANRGQWLSSVLSFVKLERACCIEPDLDSFDLLSRRFAGDGRVRCIRAAVGRREGAATLRRTHASELSSLLKPRPELARYGADAEVKQEVSVIMRRLDDMIKGPLDLLKLDLQGYEAEALSGAPQLLAETRCVLIELLLKPHYDGESSIHEVWQLLADSGFAFFDMCPPERDSTGRAIWLDATFVRC